MSKMSKKTDQVSTPEKFDKWMFYGFIAIVIALPLAMSRITFDQFDIAKILSLRLITLFMLLFWVGKMLTARKPELRWSKLDFAVVGFLALVFISTLTSIHFPTALHGKFKRYEGLLTFLNYGIIYFLAMQTFTGFKRLSTLSKAITYTGAVVALYGVMQYMGADIFSWATLPFEERRSFSTFGNPDLLGGFLVMLAPIALAEFLRSKDLKSNLLMGGSLFLILLCLLTAFTRGAWLGAGVAVVFFAIVAGKAFLSNPRKLLTVLAAFIGIFMVIAVYSATTGHEVMNLVKRIQSITQITEGSAGSRIEIWKAGLKMVEEDPLFGLGPDTFRLGSERYETLKYVQMNQGRSVADNAHNYVVQLAAGVGIPATLLFLGFLAAVVVLAVIYMRKRDSEERLIYAGLTAALVGYFIHLIFGVSISGSTGVFWVIMGALMASVGKVRVTAIIPRSNIDIYLKFTMAALVLVALVSAYFGVTMYVADVHYATALKLAGTGQYNEAIGRYEKAITLYKNGRYYDGYGMFLEQLGISQNNKSTLDKAIATYEEAVRQEPLEADHYIFLASAYSKSAASPNDPSLTLAEQELKNAIAIRPNAFSARLLLANIYAYQSKYTEAIELLDFVLSVDAGNESALRLMGQVQKSLGETEKAKAAYERLLAVKPDDAEAKTALQELAK
ncbi:MAG: O-antigen ligase family protein [Actinomycetota bacterium]|nr:O-antigen ligase family protein [Actinomycetota bacterium]